MGHLEINIHLPNLREGVGDSGILLAKGQRCRDLSLTPKVRFLDLSSIKLVFASVHEKLISLIAVIWTELSSEGGFAASWKSANDVKCGFHVGVLCLVFSVRFLPPQCPDLLMVGGSP